MKELKDNPTVDDLIVFKLGKITFIKIYFLEKCSSRIGNKVHATEYHNTHNQATSVKDEIHANEVELVHYDSNPGEGDYLWNAVGNNPGDYIVEWGNGTSTSHEHFTLKAAVLFPKVFANKVSNKYETLLNVLMPRMFRYIISYNDITPEVLNLLNGGIIKELTYLEDALLNLLDIYDINTSNELTMQLITSMVGGRLRGDNNLLWRKQVKNCVPTSKKKGTRLGLEEVLGNNGIKLTKITRLWQVISSYYWVDGFKVTEDQQNEFTLSRVPITPPEVYLRAFSEKTYNKVDVEVTESNVIWKEKFSLLKGDILKVIYNFREIPKEKLSLENYIKSLPLADSRDELEVEYPLKNWNLKLIEEEDPLFDVIVQDKHPFYDPVVYGKVRTIFLYSENVYNMDTYNGSLRNSTHPCDIDRDFLEECSYCQSSKLNFEIEIEEMSDKRIEEAKDIIKESIPFHAEINKLGVSGKLKDEVILEDSLTCHIELKDFQEEFEIEDRLFGVIEYKDGRIDEFII